jgi:hypothetical protein
MELTALGGPVTSPGPNSALRFTDRGAQQTGFGDRLHRQVVERRSQLVLGLDPDPARHWPRAIEFLGGAGASSDPPADRSAWTLTSRHERAV